MIELPQRHLVTRSFYMLHVVVKSDMKLDHDVIVRDPMAVGPNEVDMLLH